MVQVHINRNGYRVFTKTGKTVHRYIYEKNFGKIPKGMVVNHKDGNKLNNNPSNLNLLKTKENYEGHRVRMFKRAINI